MMPGSRPRFLVMAVAFAVLLPTWVSPALAAAGDRDPTFGVNGGLTTGFDDGDAQARAIAVQPDGKIVAVGHAGLRFALTRYLPNGTLEPGFGNGGRVVTDFRAPGAGASSPGESSECSPASCSGNSAQAFAVALQPDGKVVAAGGVVTDGFGGFAVARYLPNGELDPGFGDGGKAVTSTGSVDARAFALAIQPDGKLVVGGYTLRASFDFALVRYLPDGRLDPSFGDGGIVVTDFFDGMDQIRAVAIQPNGKVVAAGFAIRGGKFQFAMVRVLPNGGLDPSFGDGGKVTTVFPDGDAQGFALALEPDGSLVVAGGAVVAARPTPVPRLPLVGERNDDPRGAFALAHYLPDGTLDPSFGHEGKLSTRFGEGAAAGASSVLVQPDGKLVAAGFRHDGKRFQFALARYLPTGTLDPGFGNDGKLSIGFDGDAQAFSLVLQPDNKLVVAGLALKGDRSQFALTRHKNGVL